MTPLQLEESYQNNCGTVSYIYPGAAEQAQQTRNCRTNI